MGIIMMIVRLIKDDRYFDDYKNDNNYYYHFHLEVLEV